MIWYSKGTGPTKRSDFTKIDVENMGSESVYSILTSLVSLKVVSLSTDTETISGGTKSTLNPSETAVRDRLP